MWRQAAGRQSAQYSPCILPSARSISCTGCLLIHCQIEGEAYYRSTFAARAKPEEHAAAAASTGPDWVKKGPRLVGTGSLLAAAISSDGQLLAVGGGDKKVHVWDARSQQHVQSFPGHKDMVTGEFR